jgi:hypothetical protein
MHRHPSAYKIYTRIFKCQLKRTDVEVYSRRRLRAPDTAAAHCPHDAEEKHTRKHGKSPGMGSDFSEKEEHQAEETCHGENVVIFLLATAKKMCRFTELAM